MKEEITFKMGLRGGVFHEVHPRYSELSLECERDTGEMAFGQSLSGTLKFIDTDYDWIMTQERGVEILVTATRGTIVFYGKFVITDCDIDADNRIIDVELEADDPYTWLKGHYDDTFNLVALAPESKIIEYRRRAAWQFYRQGDKKLSVVMGGDYFELDATQVASYSDLCNKYYFNIIDAECSIYVSVSSQTTIPISSISGFFKGLASGYLYSDEYNQFRVRITLGGTYGINQCFIEYKSGNTWVNYDFSGLTREDKADIITYGDYVGVGKEMTFRYGGLSGTYFTGMYARIVHNNAQFTPKYNLPTDDIIAKTLNYNYVSIPSSDLVNLIASKDYSATPTEWGLAPDNTNYYKKPAIPAVVGISAPLYPVGKTTWGEYSWWTYFDFSANLFDYKFWDTVQLKDAYPLMSVLNVLLGAIFKDSGYSVYFSDSDFLYSGRTGIIPSPPEIYITPKTNILTANYSQRAQKGDITIGQVLDMLRDVFRCYWFIERDLDGTFELRIEHIYWFYNGGSYDSSGTPFDIRDAKDPRTGKLWEYGKAKFSFDTSELYSRYEFGWQDDCTDWFGGQPVTCKAKYVNESATNKAEIKAFSSDIDYMLLSPDDFSKDGFALLGAKAEGLFGYMYQPIKTLTGNSASEKFVLSYVPDKDAAVQLVTSSNALIAIGCYNDSGVLIRSVVTTNGARDFTMPAGTSSVTYTVSGSGTITVSLNLRSYYPRVEMPLSSEDVAPQNYRLAFHFIERAWYLADYPCRNIAFGDGDNREDYTVEGYYPIKKAMEQTLGLPYTADFDPYKGVLSIKGRALVNKYTINLLSLFQELTLMYGTDE